MTCTNVKRMNGKVKHPAKPRNGRIAIGVLLAVLLVCIAIGVALQLRNDVAEPQIDLEANQFEFVQELQDNVGEYDAQSIVLSNTSEPVARALAQKLGAKLRITKNGSFATLTLPEGTTILDIAMSEDYLADLPKMSADYHARIADVTEETAQEDEWGERLPMRPQYTVSDTSYDRQTYLDYLNMQDIWSYTQGADITVAVIDTGIDTDHPEFAGRISEYSYNATEDKIVKDYILDDGSMDWSLVEDKQGHGTAVAGVIGAAMDGNGIVGIAPQVNIIVIKAECNDAGEFERVSDLVFGLYYAIERDVSVVNMSFGVEAISDPFAAPAQLALDSDIICVAAAGNNATANLTFPAAGPYVFGVGALATNSWELAEYSNYGENVDFVAPGTVYTTQMGGGYGGMNGTSFASPITAGVLALYMSQNMYQEFLTVQELLYASCDDLGDLGPDWYYGYGALDVSALMLEERGTVTFNMMTDELDNTQQVFIRNHTLQNMPEPDRLYAIFDGWYYDPQFTEEYNWYADEFTSDLTLYAHWVNEDDGIPFTYVILDDGTVEIRSYTGHRRFITIPDYIEGRIVSSIGEEAFKGETRLREVKLPKYLKRIRRSAFEGCSNLVSMEIPDTVTEIGDKAFYDNVRLSTLIFGQESQLVSIGSFAFSGCAKMRTFTVPSKVTTLDATAFFRNTSMIAFDVQQGNTSFTAKDGVLYNNTGSTLVCYPAGLNGTFVVPEYVRTVGDYAFACTKLNGVELSSVEMLGDYAFAYGSLKSIVIPDSVTSMGKCTFTFNLNMRSAKLGRGLTNISACSFSNTALTAIEIPNGIQSISKGAFSSIGTLAVVNFEQGSNLIYIGEAAFFDSGVVSVEIPASVVTIDEGAFAALYFPYLETLIFEEGSALYTIGDSAFSLQIRLTEVDLPERLSYLGDFSFSDTGLYVVDIPASVSYFGEGAFAYCHSLENIFVDDQNAHYLDVDGVVYNTQKDVIVAYPAGNQRTSYIVLEGVTDIGAYSFCGSWNLTWVNLSSTTVTVRNNAFYDCEYVTGYGLSNVLTYIQESAFSKNYRLLSMHMPDSLMQIGRYAFAEDWSLYSVTFNETAKLPRISFGSFAYCGLNSFRVPKNVSTMAQGAFMGCDQLTSFTFAENSKLESISAYMFDGCSNLQTITFEKGSALTSIQAHGLEGMRKLTAIDFGDAKLTNIDNFAFRFCESLTRFDIPEGVTFLGRYAFYYCTNLCEVTVPASMDFIGRFAFLGTKNLNVYFTAETLPAHLAEDWDHGTKGYYLGVTDVVTEGDWKYAKLSSGDISIIEYLGDAAEIDLTSLDLGGDIVNIGGGAFAYGTVESIVLPETLQIIQAEAFYHSALQSVTVPASVTFIGRQAFASTPMQSLTFAPDAQLLTIEQSAFEKTEQLGSVTIPASVTTMGRAVFKSSGITSLHFAEGFSMTEIPEEAFAYTHIFTVTIPNSVTLINHNAFREIKELKSVTLGNGEELMIMSNVFYQSGLEKVYIPENVGYVGEYAFVALPNLTEFQVSENNPYYQAIDGLLVSKDGRKLIAVPAGRQGSLTVPEGIEVIGFGAFEDSQLSEIKFLENANILSFGYRAFYNADHITEIHIPASVVSIDYYAFAMCDNLQTVTFAEDNNLKGVYEGAFYGCKNLSDIMLPDSIVEISDFAFYGCRKLTDVPVSETTGLKGIYDYAFAYTGFAGEYTTPETLIDIGPYAFMGNQFTSITVPDTNYWDLVIGIGAFAECNDLVEITLPFIGASFEDDEITWFGYIFGAGSYEANATYVPESLKKVTINEGITVIGKYAFWGITTIETIEIPHSVTQVYDYAFGDTAAQYALTNVIYMGEWWDTNYAVSLPWGTGLTGHLELMFDPDFDGTASFQGCRNLESVTIHEGIVKMECSFSDCTSLKTVNLPSTLTYISGGAFMYCKSLESIILPENICYIGDGAFYGCENLLTVQIPENVTHLGNNMFYGCVSLNHVILPAGTTSIGEFAFGQCTSLSYINLPATLTEIGDWAFGGCETLYLVENQSNLLLTFGSQENGCVAEYAKVIVYPDGSKQYADQESQAEYIHTDDDFLFVKEGQEYRLIAYLGREEIVTLPDKIDGHSYKIYHMRGIRHAIVPGAILQNSAYAFYGSTTLQSVVIVGEITEIPGYAFSQCTKLERVTVPEGVVCIENGAFMACANLMEVILPESLVEISYHAFENCERLPEILLQSNLEHIMYGAFYGCDALTVHVVDDNPYYVERDGILYNKDVTKIIHASLTVTEICVPKTVIELDLHGNTSIQKVTFEQGSAMTSIGIAAFSECTNLAYIEIPNSVTSIDTHAFYNCRELVDITLPINLTYIGTAAFAYCSNLQNIDIPEGVTNIGYDTFYCCTNLDNVNIPNSVSDVAAGAFSECPNLSVTLAPNHEYLVEIDGVIYDKDLTKIICVPSSVTEICVPKTVTQISLAGNTNIRKVTFEEGSMISDVYFRGCRNLESITLPEGVSIIGGYAFAECESLTGITLPDTIKEIGSSAFYMCQSLASVYVSDIDTWCAISFGCEYANPLCHGATLYINGKPVTEVVIPEHITAIGTAAFYNCDSLRQVTFHDGITSIGDRAFSNCDSLEDIVIGSGVAYIGIYAFKGCERLENVTISRSVQQIDYEAFALCSNLKTVINLSDLVFTFGSEDHGCIAYNLKTIVDKNGDVHQNTEYQDTTVQYVTTEDGFVFKKENGVYMLIAYEGGEDTVELPLTFEGQSYTLYRAKGFKKVIIPDGWTEINDQAFTMCGTLVEVVIPESVERIGWTAFSNTGIRAIELPSNLTMIDTGAFESCKSLQSVVIPENVKAIGFGAFQYCSNLTDIEILGDGLMIEPNAFHDTAYVNDPNNWQGQTLYIGRHLIYLDPDTKFYLSEDTSSISIEAFLDCYSLKKLLIGGIQFESLRTMTNLETLVVTELPENPMGWYLDTPLLKSIVLTKDVRMRADAFQYITGITIYVEATEDDTRWDENFPGWNNGNRVVYGDDWINADFYDQNGNLMSSEIFLTYQIIRQPYLKLAEGLEESQVLVGWDIDGDGIADTIPATSTVDIVARPIIETKASEYVIRFYDADGVTLISKVTLPYGAEIIAPAIEEKMGYTTNGWTGYTQGMTVSDNHVFVLDRVHNGEGHVYAEPVWVAPTCTEQGYNKHVCTVCGEWYATDHVDALGHKYTGVESPATCVFVGSMTYTCSVCGTVEVETLPPKGHTYESLVVVESTCTQKGETHYKCTDCGYTVKEKTALGEHDYQKKTAPKWWLQILIEHVLNVFFGYEGDSVYYYECTQCKSIQTAVDSSSATSSGAAGIQSAACFHELGDWTEHIAPTCQTYGVEAKYCMICEKAIEFRSGSELGAHDYVQTDVVAPTCTEQGYTTHTCYCGDVYTDSYVDALGHTEVIDEAVAPTCTATGLTEGKHCSVCNEILLAQEVVPANGHAYESVVTEPTCTEKGYTTHTCHCGDTYVDSEVDALGHSPSDWIVDTEAQIGVEGSKHKECTVCGETLETEVIEALTEAPTTEVPTSENKSSGNCNGVIGIPVVLIALLGCIATAWRPRKNN